MIFLLSGLGYHFSLLMHCASLSCDFFFVVPVKIAPGTIQIDILMCPLMVTGVEIAVRLCVDIWMCHGGVGLGSTDTYEDGRANGRQCSVLQQRNVQTPGLINVSPELLQFCQSLIPAGILSFTR